MCFSCLPVSQVGTENIFLHWTHTIFNSQALFYDPSHIKESFDYCKWVKLDKRSRLCLIGFLLVQTSLYLLWQYSDTVSNNKHIQAAVFTPCNRSDSKSVNISALCVSAHERFSSDIFIYLFQTFFQGFFCIHQHPYGREIPTVSVHVFLNIQQTHQILWSL